jgi:hypothetical protein
MCKGGRWRGFRSTHFFTSYRFYRISVLRRAACTGQWDSWRLPDIPLTLVCTDFSKSSRSPVTSQFYDCPSSWTCPRFWLLPSRSQFRRLRPSRLFRGNHLLVSNSCHEEIRAAVTKDFRPHIRSQGEDRQKTSCNEFSILFTSQPDFTGVTSSLTNSPVKESGVLNVKQNVIEGRPRKNHQIFPVTVNTSTHRRNNHPVLPSAKN